MALKTSNVSKSNAFCAVAQFSNVGTKTSGIIYHRFPKNDKLRQLWISRCKRSDKFNPNNARVCSVHFRTEDYDRDLENELLGLPQRKILRTDAVPSLLIPNWHGDSLPGSSSSSSVSANQTSQQVCSFSIIYLLSWKNKVPRKDVSGLHPALLSQHE